jgi:DNA-binding transcriptional LysR family regulator
MPNLTQLTVLAAVARHGSVTEAAHELQYSQPSVSHHLSRLEAATGAKLVQRVGRGIRLTPEGQLLAGRAAEIVGRVEAASNELAARIGLQAGRVRMAANASVLSTIAPRAAAALAAAHPGLELTLVDHHPVEALEALRRGEVDVALIYRHADDPELDGDIRLVHLMDDSLHLVSRQARDRLSNHRDSAWIGGCDRCRQELLAVCRQEGFTPRIASFSDDIVTVMALVAAGIGVATVPGLALQAHSRNDVHATELASYPRRIYAATYGEAPDPPATAALICAIQASAAPAHTPARLPPSTQSASVTTGSTRRR